MTTSNPAGEGWFSQLPDPVREDLCDRGTTRRYRTGHTLFHEGDLSDWVVVLRSGRVKVSSSTPDGREVVLSLCASGDLLGELAAIDARPRSATLTAIDPVEAQIVAGDEFRRFLAGHPEASLQLLRSVCGRLRNSDRRRIEFVALDSVGRVANQLIELAERFGVAAVGEDIQIDVAISQDELAGMTGSSREAVGKALQLFRKRGWIRTGRRHITVIDLAGLRSRST